MGSGKTTVGRRLAERLGWAFWDNDEALERATGSTAGEVQRERGQRALHQLEDRLLREALRAPEPAVFAAAASVVLNPATVAGAFCVWLRSSARVDELHIAASGQHHRPLSGDAAAALERLASERDPEYARLADVTVEVASTPEETLDRVIDALGAHSSKPGDAPTSGQT